MRRRMASPSTNHAPRAKRDAGHSPFMYNSCRSLTSQNFIEFADYRTPRRKLDFASSARLRDLCGYRTFFVLSLPCVVASLSLNLRIQIEERLQTRLQLLFDIFLAALEHMHRHPSVASTLQFDLGFSHFRQVIRREQAHSID